MTRLLPSTLFLLSALSFRSLFQPAPPVATLLDLDGLATLELPASFHREPSPELELPAARRLLRRPYLDKLTLPDQVTYYLPSHDYRHVGGREIPALLRVTLYAEQSPPSEELDATYIDYIQRINFHSDEHYGHLLKQARAAGPGLWVTENEETVIGWFSTKRYTQQHLVLTDPIKKVRLFLSASDRELPRPEAELLLRQVLRSLTRDPAALAGYFAHAAQVGSHRAEARQANTTRNVREFNEQLQAAGLPPLPPAKPGCMGQFVDVGDFFYGLTAELQLVFVARLGTAPRPPDRAAEVFPGLTANWLNISSTPERLLWPPPGAEQAYLHLRRGNSEPLWLPPSEVAASQPAALLRAAAEATAQLQGQPGFAPVPRTAPAYWQLAPNIIGETRSAPGSRFDYRRARLQFPAPVGFTLHYLGQRTAAPQFPQGVFRLTTAGTFTRLPAATIYAVDATQGGELRVAGAGGTYRVRIEPLAQGHLTVEAE